VLSEQNATGEDVFVNVLLATAGFREELQSEIENSAKGLISGGEIGHLRFTQEACEQR
jgi:hypothetical protein